MHKAISLRESGLGMGGFDDELEINTQFSSQWDSLCHYCAGPQDDTYNGAIPTVKGLEEPLFTRDNKLPTIDHWHTRGGLVGRGVLIDFKRYMEETSSATYNVMDGYRITPEDIEKVAKHQGVEFKPADILIIRTGYTEKLENMQPEDFQKMATVSLTGMDSSVESARWVWNKRFSAVAGDAHAFESMIGMEQELGKFNAYDTLSPYGPFLLIRRLTLSPSQLFAPHVWHVDWRALGSQGAGRVLQEDGPVQLHADLGTSQPSRTRCVASQCAGHLLDYKTISTLYLDSHNTITKLGLQRQIQSFRKGD